MIPATGYLEASIAILLISALGHQEERLRLASDTRFKFNVDNVILSRALNGAGFLCAPFPKLPTITLTLRH